MILDFTESSFQRWQNRFFSQPHQPFFVLGFILAFLTIFVTALFFSIGLKINFTLFHVVNLLLFVSSSFFLGFLTTVLYRFLGEVPFLQKQYMFIFKLQILGIVSANLSMFFIPRLLILALAVFGIAMLYALLMFIEKYKNSKATDKFDAFWLIFLFSSSLPSILLFMTSVYYPSMLTFAINFTFFVFVIGTIFFVAQKMIPNFFTLFFNTNPVEKQKRLPLIVITILFLLSVFKSLDFTVLSLIVNILGGIASFILFYKYDIFSKKPPFILSILQIGIVWFVLGFVAGIYEYYVSSTAFLQLHIFSVGFMMTMVIGFGTRVTLGHSNQKITADRFTVLIFIIFQLVVILRIIASFNVEFILYSALGWCFVFALWFRRYLFVLLKLW